MTFHLGVFIDQTNTVFYAFLNYKKRCYQLISSGQGANLSEVFDVIVASQSRWLALYAAQIQLWVCLDHDHIDSILIRLDLADFQIMSDWWQHEAIAVEFAEHAKTDINQFYWDWVIDQQLGGIQIYYTDKQQLQISAKKFQRLRLQTLGFSDAAYAAYQRVIASSEEGYAPLTVLESIEQCTACGAVMLGVTHPDD